MRIFTATHGVMTNEVGVSSGELGLRTTCDEAARLHSPSHMLLLRTGTHCLGKIYACTIRDHEVLHRMLATVLERP